MVLRGIQRGTSLFITVNIDGDEKLSQSVLTFDEHLVALI
jgi:hypothetical protein